MERTKTSSSTQSERRRRSVRRLGGGVAKNVFAVGVEAHAPQAHARHELLRLFELAVTSEDGVDKLAAAVLAHGHRLLLARLFLGRLPHVVFADLEELGKTDPETLAALEEVLDHFAALLLADLGHDLFGALDLAGELDEEQPEFARHLGQRRTGSVVEDGPIVDPLAERVGVEDTTQQHDGLFGGVPVLVRVAGGDAGATRIFFGGFGRRLGGCRGSLGRLGLRLRLGPAGVGGATLTAGLGLLVVDGDLTMVIVISIAVRFVSCVRWRRTVVDVVEAVSMAVIVVDDLGVHLGRRLGRATLPLAMGALERRGVCVAASATRSNVTKISTYIFGRALRRRLIAGGRKVRHVLGRASVRRRVRVLLRRDCVRRSSRVALDLGRCARRGRCGLGSVAGRVVARAGRHGRRVAVVVLVGHVARRRGRIWGDEVHVRDGGTGRGRVVVVVVRVWSREARSRERKESGRRPLTVVPASRGCAVGSDSRWWM
jgi:hypothetical protein